MIDASALGALSRKYESNWDPGAISSGVGDAGGKSYGAYQLASKTGTLARFVAWLRGPYPDLWQTLKPAFEMPDFDAEWKRLAVVRRERFLRAQHDFIAATHYQPALEALRKSAPWLALDARPEAVHEVLWSTAVQHGAGGAVKVFDGATYQVAAGAYQLASRGDADLIRFVYAERGRESGGVLVHFARSSPSVQAGICRR